MEALAYWQTVTEDRSGFLVQAVALLRESGVSFCVIGGAAVNAYAEPVITLDLDVAVAADDVERAERFLAVHFRTEHFEHSINVSAPGSRLRLQIQTDPRYFPFVSRASERDVLDLRLPVASAEDVLQGKIWAYSDADRRQSKRAKDLADISRLIESYPALRAKVPSEVLAKLP